MASESYSEIAKIKQEYAQDIFTYLTYLMHKRKAEDAQEKFDENMRKLKR